MKKTILLYLLILWGCQSNRVTVDTSGMTTVPITNDRETDARELVSEMEFVALAPTGETMIGEVNELLVTDEHIIVVDKYQSKAVFIFDRRGVLTGTINRLGKGPHEYIDISHVALMPDNQSLVLYDNQRSRVLFYDLKGDYIKQQPINFYFNAMEYIGESDILCATYGLGKEDPGLAAVDDYRDLIFFTNADYKIRSGALPNQYKIDKYWSCTPHITKFNDTVYVNPSYSDTIYTAHAHGLQARYRLDMSAVNGQANFDADMTNEKLDKLRTEKTLFGGRFVDGTDYLLVNLSTPFQNYAMVINYLYSKTTGNTYRLKDDLSQSDYFLYMMLTSCSASDKNRFIAAVPAFQITTSVSQKVRDQYPALKNLDENSNPVIAFYTFKEPELK